MDWNNWQYLIVAVCYIGQLWYRRRKDGHRICHARRTFTNGMDDHVYDKAFQTRSCKFKRSKLINKEGNHMAGLGHIGFGFAAKPMAPKVHLIVLLIATELIDILWGVFYFTGIDRNKVGIDSSPWSHSLFMSVI